MIRRFVTILILLSALAVTGWWYHSQYGKAEQKQLVVFCAAGLRVPLTAAAELYEQQTGVQVSFQFGGTGTLLSQISVAKTGDLFVAADEGSRADAAKRHLTAEVLPLIRQTPVIAVRKGNPLGIRGLDDLLRPDVRTALANPEAASIGRSVRLALGERWNTLAERAAVMKPTVTEIAADLSLGSVDAAILWDSLIGQFKDLVAVGVDEFKSHPETASACLLAQTAQPQTALSFARWLAAPDGGGATFQKQGFLSVPGDLWAPQPELVIYSGAVNRPALEPLLKQWADREGVRINTVYNGCGVLCASMKTMAKDGGQMPDAYFACDLCFVPPVAEMFPEVNILTETQIVIAVQKGNPRHVKALVDLAHPGLKVGICNQQQSTLGFMTAGLLRKCDHAEDIRKNVVVEVPTADFLINQLRAGGLDAAIVYRVNVLPQSEHLEPIHLAEAEGRAVQPFGIRKGSPNAQAAQRLLAFLQRHQGEFEGAGFVWRGNGQPLQSKGIEIPAWLKPQ